ncbi:ketopantoate reductase family protein [Paenibacillus sp. sgz500958]|uniref:ketopantoate reductase family protein n=1 Tax=Paenibacillus sp. sgz500958 TaxID=3242475 RepID=UPI0036D2EF94
MKILIFGRGVIATQYAWALEKAGNTVEFYVRPGRVAQYGPLVNLEIIDARKKRTLVKEPWPITMREELDVNHDYDLIIVSVNHDQLDGVMNFLAPRVSTATVLMFNNVWVEPSDAVAQLPNEQVVWGFPGAGGIYSTANTLNGGFMKSIFMGFVGDTSVTKRYQNVRELFINAGFTISEKKDMRSWLWVHFALNVGLATQALQAGGFDRVFDSKAHLKHMMLLLRETLPLIRAKGGKVGFAATLALHLPAGLLGWVMQKVMAKGNLARDIMAEAGTSENLNRAATSIFPKDALADARRLGVPLPRLTGMESEYLNFT